MKYKRVRAQLAALAALVGLVALPGVAAADDPPGNEDESPPAMVEPTDANPGLRGEAAIEAAGDQIEQLAQNACMPKQALIEAFRTDDSYILLDGQVVVMDEGPTDHSDESAHFEPNLQDDEEWKVPLPALEDAFNLSSREGSDVTLYLDFLTDPAGKNQKWVDDPWDLNGDPSVFDNEERTVIVTVWQHVASVWAPFDVNVTTVKPTEDDLVILPDKPNDTTFGQVMRITERVQAGGAVRGGAVTCSIGNPNARKVNTPGTVFTGSIIMAVGGDLARNIGDVLNHEFGHTFGLNHDRNEFIPYFSGYENWAPIMGKPWHRDVGQWSKGDFEGAVNKQDDIAQIASVAPFVPDEDRVGTSGYQLEVNNAVTAVIADRNDVDRFEVPSSSSRLQIRVIPTTTRSMLNSKVTVKDASGKVVGTSDRPGVVPEWVTLDGNAGPFVVEVDGVGEPNNPIGYDDYSSIGEYQIIASTDILDPPVSDDPVDAQGLCFGVEPTIRGTEADDVLTGTPGNDVILAGAGNDEINGLGGDDIICGDNDADTILGGEGNDRIDGGLGPDTINGEGGNDQIRSGFGNDFLEGGDGDDDLDGGTDDNTMFGGAGNDRLVGGPQGDKLFGGGGKDTIKGGSGGDQIEAGAGDDTVYGDAGKDKIKADAGNDIVYGGDGNDTIYGGNGNDRIWAGTGVDTVYGEAGNDTIETGAGHPTRRKLRDRVWGGDGDDRLNGGPQPDELNGGNGNDKLGGRGANDTLIGGAGNDLLSGSAGDDVVYAGPGKDRIFGGPGKDNIFAGKDADRVWGGRDDDTIRGELGDDNLLGEAGNDTVNGGPGKDKCQAERRSACE